jgi:probable HAF family extracellular repeat protein
MLMSAPSQAVPLYSITDMGSRTLIGLNNAGEIVGSSSYYSPTTAAPFLYQNGKFTDLTPALGATAMIRGITDSGQVYGGINGATGGSGFIPNSNGQVTWINPHPGQHYAGVSGLDSGGDMLYWSGIQNLLSHQGTTTNINALYAGQTFGVWTLGEGGQAIGSAYPASNLTQEHAFVYQNGKLTDVGSLGGLTEAFGVNRAGQVIGFSATSLTNYADTEHAYVSHNGTITDLGTLGGPRSYAFGINNLGQIVGASDVVPGAVNRNSDAFLYQGGTMYDLNKLIPPGSGWTLLNAIQINDLGQIIGSGIRPDGQMGSFLLTPTSASAPDPTPVPEPSVLSFVGLCLSALVLKCFSRPGTGNDAPVPTRPCAGTTQASNPRRGR